MESTTFEQTQTTAVTALLDNIALVEKALSQKKAGAREQLVENA
jgi:hypothetical protein